MDYGRTTPRNAAMRHIPIKASGIYKITNSADGKIYIGASHDIRKRLRAHLETLRKSEHPSGNLQSAYDASGEHAFTFEVLEFCHPNKTFEREQAWLNLTRCFDSLIGYNVCEIAGPPPKIVYTAEMRETMSRRRKGVAKSAEHRQKIGVAHKGRTKSPEAIAKQRAALKAYWADPENRAKQSAKRKGCVALNKGVPHTAEARAKISAGAKLRASTPEGKAILFEKLKRMNSP
jgi:group I intron endonuclease